MGLFDRFLNRPPSQDRFAGMLLDRVRASGDHRPVTYDAAGFRLVRSNAQVMFLGNTYKEYLRGTKEQREIILRRFLAMWHTSEKPVPEDFDLVKADLLPALRARSYLEVDLRLVSEGDATSPPYEIIGDHLALSLVYDLPDSMMTVSDELLEKWGVSFYEAMEVARQNLHDKPAQCAQIGSAYALTNGDAYDATRLIALDFIRQLTVPGGTIAMVPNRERLYIAGSEDPAGLAFMLHFAEQDVQHERYISGLAFRLEGDEWQPWLPPAGHEHHDRFRRLQLQTMGEMYGSQERLLQKQHAATGLDVFVASFSGRVDKTTGRGHSLCMWAEGVDTFLPETDEVYFVRPNGDDVTTVARADWQTVQRCAGDLMEPQGLYPERWRVRSFPDAATLANIGNK